VDAERPAVRANWDERGPPATGLFDGVEVAVVDDDAAGVLH